MLQTKATLHGTALGSLRANALRSDLHGHVAEQGRDREMAPKEQTVDVPHPNLERVSIEGALNWTNDQSSLL